MISLKNIAYSLTPVTGEKWHKMLIKKNYFKRTFENTFSFKTTNYGSMIKKQV
jgi:hypothetical protein